MTGEYFVEPYNLIAYVIAAIVSLAVAYLIGRLGWPRWALWSFAIACFLGSVLIPFLFHSWSSGLPWPDAVRIALVAVSGATAGIAFHGGLGAHLRPDKSLR
jgi:peptidoglycan/LPS O-acetylase OafA/YrhL